MVLTSFGPLAARSSAHDGEPPEDCTSVGNEADTDFRCSFRPAPASFNVDDVYPSQPRPTLVRQAAVTDIHDVAIKWPISPATTSTQLLDESMSFLSHIVGYEGPGSLLHRLRNTSLASAVSVGLNADTKAFRSMEIRITLSTERIETEAAHATSTDSPSRRRRASLGADAGTNAAKAGMPAVRRCVDLMESENAGVLEATDGNRKAWARACAVELMSTMVVTSTLQFLTVVAKAAESPEGLPSHLFDDFNKTRALAWRFAEKQPASSFVSDLAIRMQRYEAADWLGDPARQFLTYESMEELLSQLTLNRAMLWFVSNAFEAPFQAAQVKGVASLAWPTASCFVADTGSDIQLDTQHLPVQREQVYGVLFTHSILTAAQTASLPYGRAILGASCQRPVPDPALYLPQANPFLPDDFTLIQAMQEDSGSADDLVTPAGTAKRTPELLDVLDLATVCDASPLPADSPEPTGRGGIQGTVLRMQPGTSITWWRPDLRFRRPKAIIATEVRTFGLLQRAEESVRGDQGHFVIHWRPAAGPCRMYRIDSSLRDVECISLILVWGGAGGISTTWLMLASVASLGL